MKILCIGEEWRGSNASGLFWALARLGHSISMVNELTFVNVRARGVARVANRLIRPLQVRDFNEHVKKVAKSFQPSLILVYKGAFLMAETLRHWHEAGVPIVNFFPDVSFLAHGSHIPACIPIYDHIFTTKSFGAADLQKNFGIPVSRVSFVPHGFDPLIHRPISQMDPSFSCDASFIGNYSAHKEEYLSHLKSAQPMLDIKIWGATWGTKRQGILAGAIQGISIEGDLYATALSNSRINIALLSERVAGASRGDQITSRTFHIPAAGGFMLHERTDELLKYFVEEKEVACFGSAMELSEKIDYFLKAERERERIRQNGHARALKDHGLDARARAMMNLLKENGIVC